MKKRYLLVNELEISHRFLKHPCLLIPENRLKISGDKTFILQANYYKKSRKGMDLLLEDGKPVGGKWSFDDENRKSFLKVT